MTDYAFNRQHVLTQIANVAASAQAPAPIVLLAVSKMQPDTVIRQLVQTGQQDFAENYLQEALSKQALLSDLALTWHFIGHIQRNKTKAIAENFAWVHSVDRLLIAERLSTQRPAHLPALNVCIQINIDDEDSKSGCAPTELNEFVAAMSKLPHMCLRGIMIIPAKDSMDAFIHAKELFNAARTYHAHPSDWDTLSMGMSADFEQAIAAGATMVRVGTALFGDRNM